jgi:hypothetical protein
MRSVKRSKIFKTKKMNWRGGMHTSKKRYRRLRKKSV